MFFERSTDYDLVRKIITHPTIYPHVTDDFSPAAAEFQPNEHPEIWYMIVRDRDEVLGCFMFVPASRVCWEVHVCMLPAAWGARSVASGRLLSQWIWQNTECRRIVASVPETNRRAIRFAIASGMEQYGRNRASFAKRGRLVDQILLGMSPQE